MNKLLLIAIIAFSFNAKAQIILEQDYDSAASYASGTPSVLNQLMIVNFEESGDRYIKINRLGKCINIYDITHVLIKTIDLSGFPMNSSGSMGEVLYLSEHLFNLDSKIEFIYGFSDSDSSNTLTNIYNEDGTLIFSSFGAPMVKGNIPQQQLPIYNTINGAKMILSYHDGHAKVYSLPGTLSTAIAEANGQLIQAQEGLFKNLYPNPSTGKVTLQYQLPEGTQMGEIILYNMQGTEVKRYAVDSTFNDIILDNSDLQSGTYFYQLQTNNGGIGTKKMIKL
ncbi:MAG TPA: hypothetical protein DDX39_08305 [Bacteroidales bacterium]|nr:MAG: hypothetical protein A2W98_09775 [Bacteroidetes bacterium GWF2_33_38]OFY73090.1 MAG: hypothetical protein A2265_00425 [Bacteroidetes bacterium RIFOXYA12_FULL_33_9]OFY90254.1 MAG: hypothetical protein A2236_04655 [Bacteroidetes bacterium RIFOXYA2_FULL_33_7]HBF88628.1 hypothetical protein [Bacteroidales bacterium]